MGRAEQPPVPDAGRPELSGLQHAGVTLGVRQGTRSAVGTEPEDADDSPIRLAAAPSDLQVRAALVAAAPSLNPSRGARNRMHRRLIGTLLLIPERPAPAARSTKHRRMNRTGLSVE
jgi:hypothetical protein